MITGTLIRMAAGSLTWAALSCAIGIPRMFVYTAGWPAGWDRAGQFLQIALTVAALVWATGLARRSHLGAWPTGVLALTIGVVVGFVTAWAGDLLFPVLWHTIAPAAREPMMSLHDARWASSKLAECAMYVLPFAAWRAWQQRRDRALAGAAA